MRSVLVLVVFVALAACGEDGNDLGDADNGSDDEAPLAVEPETIAKGSQGPPRAGEIVARSAEEFRQAWAEHGGEDPPSVEGVDFGRQMVVAVFQGEQPSAGYGVEIVSVRSDGRVRYVASRPDPDTCVTAAVITAPFHVVAVPAFDGDVEFQREDLTVRC